MRNAHPAVKALLTYALLGVLLLNSSADEPSDDLKSDRVRLLNGKADEINRGFQQVCAKYHLRYFGSARFAATWAKDRPEPHYTCPMFLTGPVTTVSLAKVNFAFRDQDNQLTQFGNYNDDDTLEGKALYNGIQQPKWTKSYATEVGKAFEAVLPIPRGTLLSSPQVEFRQDRQDGGKHGLGHWWFTWWKTDTRGNPLYDHICFCMREGFCPSGGAVLLSTPFHEVDSALLDKADALSRISIPGSTLTHSALHGVIPFSGPYAGKEIRLVWEFWFDPPTPLPDPWYVQVWNYLLGWPWVSKFFGPPPVAPPPAYPFSIWIDAYTGEAVGGG